MANKFTNSVIARLKGEAIPNQAEIASSQTTLLAMTN
jgi:hypothetical protein